MCPCSREEIGVKLVSRETTPQATPTWVLVPYSGVHEEPIVQSDELKKGEAGPSQIAKSGRVNLPI